MGGGPFSLAWHADGGLAWLQWDGAGVRAAFPTREGGVSPAPYDTLNLGLSVDDDPARVLENRRRLCAALGVDHRRLVVPGQVHETAVAVVGEAEAGRGALSSTTVIAGHDGLLTATPDLPLAVSAADCLPVVLAARTADGPALAAVHAGWRGTLAGIVGLAAGELGRLGTLAGAVVGPSIGPCCFSAGEEVVRRFEHEFPGSTGAGRVDLWGCARAQLEAAGLPAGAVTVSAVCTSCDRRFFSHRRDRGLTGRHVAVAWREGPQGAAPGGGP
jgi:hypothetical protein